MATMSTYPHTFWASYSGALADEQRPFEWRNLVEKQRMMMMLKVVEGASSILVIWH